VLREIERLHRSEKVPLSAFGILYRTNAQSRAIEDAFVRAGMPYRLVGGVRFYERREVKDVLAYLRLIQNPFDAVSLQRVINLPPRGIGQKTVQELLRWSNVQELRNKAQSYDELAPENGLAAFLEDVSLVQDVDQLDESGAPGEAVTLITLHAAKGLEYPYVFLVGIEEGVLPHQRSVD